MAMDIRQVSSPTETRDFDTQQLRSAYLIESLFVSGEICMTYSHLDRTVVGGAMPLGERLAPAVKQTDWLSRISGSARTRHLQHRWHRPDHRRRHYP